MSLRDSSRKVRKTGMVNNFTLKRELKYQECSRTEFSPNRKDQNPSRKSDIKKELVLRTRNKGSLIFDESHLTNITKE